MILANHVALNPNPGEFAENGNHYFLIFPIFIMKILFFCLLFCPSLPVRLQIPREKDYAGLSSTSSSNELCPSRACIGTKTNTI